MLGIGSSRWWIVRVRGRAICSRLAKGKPGQTQIANQSTLVLEGEGDRGSSHPCHSSVSIYFLVQTTCWRPAHTKRLPHNAQPSTALRSPPVRRNTRRLSSPRAPVLQPTHLQPTRQHISHLAKLNTTQAAATHHPPSLRMDDDMWVDNPPPNLSSYSGGDPTPSTSQAAGLPSPYFSPSFDPHSQPRQHAEYDPADPKGKRRASPPPPHTAASPFYPSFPMGPAIPILRAGQERTAFPPSPRIHSASPVPSDTSYPTQSASPDANDGEDEDEEESPPQIRIRRVGALNISVSSGSESSFSSRRRGRKRRKLAQHPSADSSADDETTPEAPSSESAGRHRPAEVDGAQHRQIVDGLALESEC